MTWLKDFIYSWLVTLVCYLACRVVEVGLSLLLFTCSCVMLVSYIYFRWKSFLKLEEDHG